MRTSRPTHFSTNHLKAVGASGQHPVSAPTDTDPEAVAKFRHLDCRSYDGCLGLAVDNDWPGFSCEQCTVFEPLTPEDQIAQGRRISAVIDRGTPWSRK